MHPARQDFPFFASASPIRAFLDSAASSQKAACVLEAMSSFAVSSYANIHRGVHSLAGAATQAYEDARTATAGFLGVGQPSSIVFTQGTTHAANMVAHILAQGLLPRGSTIVATLLDHHSNYLPWQRLAASIDGQFVVAPITTTGEIDIPALDTILATHRVGLVALPHASNVMGTVLTVADITSRAHAAGAVVFVDGAQMVAHRAVDIPALGADFYAFSAHKLYGPTGIGVLYIAPAMADRLPPYQLGGGMVHRVGDSFATTTWAPAPYRWEAGTPPIIEAVGLQAAIRYVTAHGFAAIQAHEDTLLAYLLSGLATVPGIVLYGAPSDRVGVVSFNLADIHPHDVGTILDQHGVAVRVGHHCAQPLMAHLGITGCVRASLGIYNNIADIDLLVAGLRAAHRQLS